MYPQSEFDLEDVIDIDVACEEIRKARAPRPASSALSLLVETLAPLTMCTSSHQPVDAEFDERFIQATHYSNPTCLQRRSGPIAATVEINTESSRGFRLHGIGTTDPMDTTFTPRIFPIDRRADKAGDNGTLRRFDAPPIDLMYQLAAKCAPDIC